MEYFLGIDIGSISTKGVIIDNKYQVIASSYLETGGNPVSAVTKVLDELKSKVDNNIKIVGIGTTGSARKLIGTILNATVIKNEITAHAVGTTTYYPDVKTILEIGGQDSKIILLEDKIVTDYAMNTLCAAGTGSFLSSQARRLDVKVEDFGNIAINSKNPVSIAARCTVFAESDLVHKMQMGYKKEDIIAGLCKSVALNYLNNVGKGKKINSPIIFQGGVSKNIGVKHAFEELLNTEIITSDYGHLMGAIGIAILASKSNKRILFDFSYNLEEFETKGIPCNRCPNHCEIISVRRNNKIIDSWGNRCEKGNLKTKV